MGLKRDGWYFFRWALVLALLALAYKYIDWPLVIAHLGLTHLVAIFAVQPLQFFVIFILAARFLLLTQGQRKNGWVYFEAYLLCVGLNSFVPGRLSELVKVSYLWDRAGVAVASSLAGIFLEKITDFFFLCLIALMGVGMIWFGVDFEYALVGLVMSVVLLLTLPWLESMVVRVLSKLPGKRFHSVFQKTISQAAILVRTRAYAYSVGLSAMVWLISFGMVVVVLGILHDFSVGLGDSLIIFIAMAIGRAIPGLPASIGTFEAAVVFAMHQLGFGFSESFATALTIHASQLVVVTLVSMLVLLRNGIGLRAMIHRLREFDART